VDFLIKKLGMSQVFDAHGDYKIADGEWIALRMEFYQASEKESEEASEEASEKESEKESDNSSDDSSED
jgi:hypothetical protein